MNKNELLRLKREMVIYFSMSFVTALMALFKAFGAMAIGAFPWYYEAIASAILLVFGVNTGRKLSKARSNGDKGDGQS